MHLLNNCFYVLIESDQFYNHLIHQRFPIAAKSLYLTENENFQLVSINSSRFDTTKHRATPVVSDAKIGLQELSKALGSWKAPDVWYQRSIQERNKWDEYVAKESGPTNQELPSYAHAVGAVYRNSDPSDIVVTAAGGLVGEVVQIWKPKELNTFETEWGFSCMGYEISGALGIKMAKPNQDVNSILIAVVVVNIM